MKNRRFLQCLSLCILSLIVTLSSISFASLAVPLPAKAAGRFTVQGSKIISPDGNEFVIKGTNINGPNWVWPIEMTQYADVIANTWRFNLVRVNSVLKSTHFPDNNDTDKIVDAFISRGVVVLFEAHDWTGTAPGGDDLTLLADWHKNLAQRYKNNSYVWFNVYNEPFYCQSPVPTTWLDVHRTVASAIRSTGADNIIVADGHNFGSDQGCNGQDDPVPSNMSASRCISKPFSP